MNPYICVHFQWNGNWLLSSNTAAHCGNGDKTNGLGLVQKENVDVILLLIVVGRRTSAVFSMVLLYKGYKCMSFAAWYRST
jgi:hypothetical protein